VRTEGGCRRYFHQDIADFTFNEVRVERNRLRLRLAFDIKPAPWLLERIAALDAAYADVFQAAS
jgi:hypothetical protein